MNFSLMAYKNLMMVAFLLFTTICSPALSQDDIDFYRIAKTLVANGQFQKARSYIKTIPNDADVSKARLAVIKGRISLGLKDYKNSRVHFELAQKEFQEEEISPPTELYLYICQSYFLQKDYAGALKALNRYSEKLSSEPKSYIIKANTLWKLDRKEEAWNELRRGKSTFPKEVLFKRQQIVFLLEMNLLETAYEELLVYLLENAAPPGEFLNFAVAMREKKSFHLAYKLFELGLIRFPNHEMLNLELANTYFERGRNYLAAVQFEKMSRSRPKYIKEASELYRRAGFPMRAENLNSRIEKLSVKLKQRLSIYLDMEKFELASSMEKELLSLKLLEDQDIKYAMAYSHFQNGKLISAKRLLSQINEKKLLQKSLSLRELIKNCEELTGDCP